MKINIQKIVKLGTTFCAVCSLVLFCFCPRAYALDLELIEPERIYPADYIVDTVVDGDSKTVTYRFDDTAVRVNLWGSPSGAKISSLYLGTGSSFNPNLAFTSISSDTGFMSRVYVFGSEAFDGQDAPVGVLDISDIMPGASLDLTLDYDLTFEYWQGAVTQAQVVMTAGVFCYDAGGSYLKTVYFSEVRETINFETTPSSSQIVTYDPECMLTLDSGVSLILPFTSYNFTILDGKPLSACNVAFTPDPFDITCDINMVYENSQTMDAIKDQLGDISQGIQDTNDKLDDVSQGIQDMNDRLDDVNDQMADTNDKLDTIIDGTPEQQATAAEKSDEAANMRDQVQDMISQKDSVVKPDAADIDMDISDVVDDDSVSMLTSSIAPIYDMPVVTNYFAVFGSVLVISFILFGKKR